MSCPNNGYNKFNNLLSSINNISSITYKNQINNQTIPIYNGNQINNSFYSIVDGIIMKIDRS